MLTGVVLIVGGILIAIFPHLLSISVTGFLIFLGVIILFVARDDRKFEKRHDSAVIHLIFPPLTGSLRRRSTVAYSGHQFAAAVSRCR